MVAGACSARHRVRVEFLQMDDFYRENILDHYKNPRNSGHLDHPTSTAEGVNPLCGDELAVELEVADGVVQDVRFNGHGCAISQAAASMISDVAKGKTVAEVRALGSEDVLEELGIPLSPIRLKCALLSVNVLRVALGDDSDDRDIEWKSA
jgi:nitrogen fixation NifU-like protein